MILENMLYLSSSPHIRSSDSSAQIMRQVIYALLPACAAGLLFFGLPALLVLVESVASCLVAEAVCNVLMKRDQTLSDGSAVITGILLAMNLPPSSPWWMVLFGSFIAIVIGKQVYGGLGYNPFNPALVARVVLLISFPVQMTTWTAAVPFTSGFDAVAAATPLGEMKNALSLTGKLPENSPDLLSMAVGNIPGSFGEVSALLLLLGGLYLLWRKVITWHIPFSFIGAMVAFSGVLWLVDSSRYPDPLFHLLTGGLLLGAFFMATDMVTSPVTPRGMIVFGIGCGVITVLIRQFGGYPEGVSFAILLMNAATPLIDRYTRPRKFGAKKKQKGGAV